MLGLIIFILIPGYYLFNVVVKFVEIDIIGYSFIFGLFIQIINISVYYVISEFLWLDFNTLIMISTIISITILKSISLYLKTSLELIHLRKYICNSFYNPITYIFIISLIIRTFYSSFNVISVLPDASLYLDSARELVLKGIFTSNILYDESSLLVPQLATYGLIEHVFVSFIFALFFLISNISMRSALIGITLISSLIIYPINNITKKFFNENAAIIVSSIFAIHPLFLYFSSILHGPEISSLLFMFTSIYIIIECNKYKNIFILCIAGMLLGVVHEIWWSNFYIIMIIIPLLFIYYIDYNDSLKERIKKLFIPSIFIFLYTFALKVSSLYFIYFPILVFVIISFIISLKEKNQIAMYSTSLIVGLIIPSILKNLRRYLIPIELYPVISSTVEKGLIQTIINAFTLFLNYSLLNGISEYYKYLTYHTSNIFFILFIISFFIGKKWCEKFILGSIFLIHLILVSMVSPLSYPEYLYSHGRQFLLPIIIILVGVSYLLSTIFKGILDGNFIFIIKKGNETIPIKVKYIIIFVLSVFLGTIFIPQYLNGIEYISMENPLNKYGWNVDILTWIENNTSEQDVFLSARPRELAWFTNRKSVIIAHPKLESKLLGYNELNELVNMYNASYIVVDRYFSWMYPNLKYLYDSLTLPIGTPIIPMESISSSLPDGFYNLCYYQLVFSNTSNGVISGIYKINSYDDYEIESLCKENKFNETNYEKKNVEYLSNKNNKFTLIYKKDPLNIILRKNSITFFAWKISEVNNAILNRIELRNQDGKAIENLMPKSVPSIWVTYINVENICNIRPVLIGDQKSSINIEWIVIEVLRWKQ